jgi:uncharacterized damage-inducible protein DinB
MTLREALLAEFDQEMANTRKSLERVPDDRLEWRPHPKSSSLGRLATHLAEIPAWAATALEQDSFDLVPPGSAPHQPAFIGSHREVLELFDKNVAAARAALAGVSDESLAKPWSLLSGGKTIFTLPRLSVFRNFVLNHSIHHRAQLGVYLRLNDLPVPALYGPSADEESS